MYGAKRLPVAAATLSLSAASEAAPGRSPIHVLHNANCQRWRGSCATAPALAHELDVSRRDRVKALDVPHQAARERGHPAPPQDVLDGECW